MRTRHARTVASLLTSLLVVACSGPVNPAPITASPSPPPSAAALSSPTPTASTPATASPSPASPAAVRPAPGRIAAGYEFTCAISGGGVKCWGDNRSGQLGNGTRSETPVPGPVDVSGLPSDTTAIAAGGFHACALSGAGGVQCWGSNEYGQLGDGSTTDRSVPTEVSGLTTGVTAISAGWGHTCALTSDGAVKCWGSNTFGRLGNGTSVDSSLPTKVSGLDRGVLAIAAGGLHACALMDTGGVRCWGDGQSADPDVPFSDVPVDVPGLASGVTAISATMNETCALATDDAVTCWGPNLAPPPGESLPDRFVALDVSGIATGVASIALGESHGCVLSNGSGISCWGNNWYGELGSVTMTPSPVPAPIDVPGLGFGVSAIAVGGMHTCAITGPGAVKCWGSNASGQLGSEMRCSNSSAPVDVPLDGHVVTPPAEGAPTGRIEHASGSTDVLLRLDGSPDVGVDELGGEFFDPWSFTLYGDGTVIFPSDGGAQPAADGPIIRGRPFRIAHLDDDQVQSLLRFAIGEGGLGAACERYETEDTDVGSHTLLSLHVVGLDKRVIVMGPNPLGPLFDHLRAFDRTLNVSSQVWVPDRYRGNLVTAGPWIEMGVLPDPGDTGTASWPWPDIRPDDFVGITADSWVSAGRRIMSPDEAAVLGLSADGGVVPRIYLLGPDDKTIYSFSMWPMLPDEAG